MQKKSILFKLLIVVAMYIFIIFPAVITSSLKQDQTKNMQKAAVNGEKKNDISMEKYKIIIDPGHGGIDSGVEKGYLVESEIALDISDKLKKNLEGKSITVDMTRSFDISLYKLSNIEGTLQRKELDARANIINKSGAKIYVSIHVNSYPQHPEMSGSIVYYNPIMPLSKELSEIIQQQLNRISDNKFKRNSHIPQQADFYLLKNTTIPGVLVETAFMTNSTDYKLLANESFRSRIATAIADGIQNYKDRNGRVY